LQLKTAVFALCSHPRPKIDRVGSPLVRYSEVPAMSVRGKFVAMKPAFTAAEIAELMALDRAGGDVREWARQRSRNPSTAYHVALRERCRPLTYEELKARRDARSRSRPA
jgi:hypothetical protein